MNNFSWEREREREREREQFIGWVYLHIDLLKTTIEFDFIVLDLIHVQWRNFLSMNQLCRE